MARVFSSWQVSRRGAGRASAHHTTVAEAYYLMLSARALWQQSKSFKSGRRGRFLANSHTPVHGGHRAVLNRRRSGSREAGRAQRKHLGQRQQESLARSRMNESPGCGPLYVRDTILRWGSPTASIMLSRLARLATVRRLAGGAAAAAAAAAATSHTCALAEPAAKAPPQPAAGQDAASDSSWLPGPLVDAYEAIYDNLIRPYADPSRDKLLPDLPAALKGREKPTLVISLDGTLIESQWTRQFGWRYVKRPGVDEFIEHLAPFYELVLWTECMSSADTAINRLDTRRRLGHRLYRDSTTYANGEHRKDLSHLNRNLDRVVIVDCAEYAFADQPRHGIVVKPYISAEDVDKEDKSLQSLVPFLIFLALAARKGTLTGSFADELQALGVSTTLDDGGGAFKEAVNKRFADLRAQNKLPAQRGGGGASGGTLWERLRAGRG